LVEQFKALVQTRSGKPFPQDAKAQLQGAIEAVFRSWNNSRAIYYRNLNKIDHNLGTAVNVQSMVFGNFDDTSATGVCFTRNPSTGEKLLYGEYLVNAQGEDVVAGTRTPLKISDMAKGMPSVYEELIANVGRLEHYYRDMQDIEFTIEQGKLYLLQTRSGKRTAAAAVKVRDIEELSHTSVAGSVGEFLEIVIGRIDIDMRREEKDVDAVKLDAIDRRVCGEVDHRIEIDERLTIGGAFTDDAWPGGVVEFGVGVWHGGILDGNLSFSCFLSGSLQVR